MSDDGKVQYNNNVDLSAGAWATIEFDEKPNDRNRENNVRIMAQLSPAGGITSLALQRKVNGEWTYPESIASVPNDAQVANADGRVPVSIDVRTNNNGTSVIQDAVFNLKSTVEGYFADGSFSTKEALQALALFTQSNGRGR